MDIDTKQSKVRVTISDLLSGELLSPDIQRNIDQQRVEDIIEFQRKYHTKHNSLLFLGDIVVAKCDDKFFVIDGQHRLSAMKHVKELQPDYCVCVNIISCNDLSEMVEMFMLINKCQPVPEHVIKTTTNIPKRYILDCFKKAFSSDYTCFISQSLSPRRPNVNIDILADKIFKSNLLGMFPSSSALYGYFVYVNDNKFPGMNTLNIPKCIEKAQKNNSKVLYLSNDPGNLWLERDDWIKEYLDRCTQQDNETMAEKMTNYFKLTENEKATWQQSRRNIPKGVRGEVWRKYYGNIIDGSCPLCKTQISIDNFDCGHIVSYKNGGSDGADNLMPLCSKCNKGMGAIDLNEYCRVFNITATQQFQTNPCQ